MRKYRMFGRVAFCGMLLALCACSPKAREFPPPSGARQHTTSAPLLTGGSAPDLVWVRDLDINAMPVKPALGQINDLASDTDGRVYIADGKLHHITVVDSLGTYVTTIGRPGSGPLEFPSGGPWAVAWLPSTRAIVTYSVGRLSMFAPTGDLIRSIAIPLRRPELAGSSYGFAQIDVEQPPFCYFDAEGRETHRFGLPFDAQDAQWQGQRDHLASLQDLQYGGISRRVGVHYDRLPYVMEVAQDSLFIHPLVYREGYRCWNALTGDLVWQLNLTEGDWEPPTFYRYSTSGENDMISWGTKQGWLIHDRSSVSSMSWNGRYLFTATRLEGDGKRKKPDRTFVKSPSSANEELMENTPLHTVLDVFDVSPQWLARIPLDVTDYPIIEVLSRDLIVVAVNDPEPRLSFYRIEGLSRRPQRD